MRGIPFLLKHMYCIYSLLPTAQHVVVEPFISLIRCTGNTELNYVNVITYLKDSWKRKYSPTEFDAHYLTDEAMFANLTTVIDNSLHFSSLIMYRYIISLYASM
jgi:hypothetical protein